MGTLTVYFEVEVRDRIAVVTFDTGRLNTLSRAVIEELDTVVTELGNAPDLLAVVLKGNQHGLGAGADINELKTAQREELAELIDRGHKVLSAIENSPVPWVAAIDGMALGGILELALACRGRVATERSALGFPEIQLAIFPGLGGTQRAPRLCGLLNSFPLILQGRNVKAQEALGIGLVDAIVNDSNDLERFAGEFATSELLPETRPVPADLEQAESLRPLVADEIRRATGGRDRPRAPFAALDVMIQGAQLPLPDAIQLERDAFLEVATSSEAKAGMRLFFAKQAAEKRPAAGTPRWIQRVGVDGADGFMGNGIAWLALEAGYEVVAHVPLAEFTDVVIPRLRDKYAYALKKGKVTAEEVERRLGTVIVTAELSDLFNCDLVIEARAENREIKAAFYRALGGGLQGEVTVASNSSSMGPMTLAPYFVEGGGNPTHCAGLHFFGPAERMPLVEIVVGEATSPDTVATLHQFARSLKKTPVIVNDGSIGFLVNAGLAVYLQEAERLWIEGTPIDTIDAALKAAVFPMGPFAVCDSSGVDIAAGLFDTLAEAGEPVTSVLIPGLRELKRFGKKSGGGFYDYGEAVPDGTVFAGLDGFVQRGSRVASDDEIVKRCLRALYAKARELCDRAIVSSEEQCDLAFIMGIGFAPYLGGPIFYAQQQEWDREPASVG